jgi:hypothetical protein
MNAEPRGAANLGNELDPADAQLHGRLARTFEVELARAEHDYPALKLGRAGGRSPVQGPTRGGARSGWPRLASGLVAVGVFAVVGLIGLGLAYRPGTAAGPASLPPGPATGTIPAQIDGQPVYSVTDPSQWEALTGSFLLRAYVIDRPIPCASPAQTPASSAEADLVPECGVVALVGEVNVSQVPYAIVKGIAPRGRALLTPWIGGPEIVIRVHTHDPEAAECGADLRAACDSAFVVEAVVWPATAPTASPPPTATSQPSVPTQIDGERVYRAADQASFPTSGSFLLGGVFTKPAIMAPCVAPIGLNDAEQRLVYSCDNPRIDGLELAPSSTIDEPNDEVLVARVHIHDPLAAQCSATYAAQCDAAIVVESVVWRSTGHRTCRRCRRTCWAASSVATPAARRPPTSRPTRRAVATGWWTGSWSAIRSPSRRPTSERSLWSGSRLPAR